MVSDKIFLSFSLYKSMGANEPQGVASFREEDFLSFFLYKSLGANDPWGLASLDPRVLI